MILYVNGDSNSAGAEAVNDYNCASDDPLYKEDSKWNFKPHPHNLEVSYGKIIADQIGMQLICDALAGASNYRIIRTTLDFITQNKPNIIIIGWAPWDREEWFDKYTGEYYQIGVNQIGKHWPNWAKLKHKELILNSDYNEKSNLWHEAIWSFHQDLNHHAIPHLFFNCFNTFDTIKNQLDWGNSYINPYSTQTYYSYLRNCGFPMTKSNHFGPSAHRKWAEYLLPYVKKLIE